MQVAISDTGPLIWLAKVKALTVLREIYHEIIIPEAVYREAVQQGLAEGYKDAEYIRDAIVDGWIRVEKAPMMFEDKIESVERRLRIQLGVGEREAISLALSLKAHIILTNDKLASTVAKILGLKPRGILYILLKAVKNGVITSRDARLLLEKMVDYGFWISPSLLTEFYKTLEEYR